MAQFSFLNVPKHCEERQDYLGKNSEVFTFGDPLTVASGVVKVATAGDKVLGFANETATMTSTNTTVAKVYPKYIPAYPGLVMLGEGDTAWATTDPGLYADLVGTTGSMNLNLAGGSTGQFALLKGDPRGVGSTTEMSFTVAEPQYLAFAQA